MTTMSGDSTFFAKPRVRFSQTANIEENSEDLPAKEIATRKALPKIKSVISVRTPVKILSMKKQSNNAINTNVPSIDDKTKKESGIFCDSTYSLPEKKDDCSSQDRLIHRADDKESLTSPSIIENVNANGIRQTSTVSEKSLHKDIPNVIPSITFSTSKSNNEDSCNVLKPKNNVVTNNSKLSIKNRHDREKENKNVKGASQFVAKPSCSKPTINIKKKANVSEIGVQKSNFRKRDAKSLNKPCTLNIEKQVKRTIGAYSKHPQNNLSTRSTAVNVMPCHKYTKILAKSKTSPVKKSIVRDIVVPNVKTYIESGIPKRHSDSDVHQIGEGRKMRSHITLSEKLSHPEYNSIVCIANKLNEVEKEKIVIDIEHLPTTYKRLINGKTSSALDFPLNEAIYKNLVDLSINEKQFPCKIMRSRDPQPRQKDLVPKLSDFFIPESIEEYYTSVGVKPRNPNIMKSWNAFQISDKIGKWKNNVDNY